jgi:hypothetical protein
VNAQVQHYSDSLERRAFPARFRNIGNPFQFLNEVGIIPVLEYIYKGNMLIDVAECLNVSLTILRTWVENEGHAAAVEEAEILSAEGYLAEGMKKMRTAETPFELTRAREMIKHAQFMASKKNKKTYGNQESTQAGAGVSYVFNIGNQTSAPQLVKDVVQTIEHKQDPLGNEPVPRVAFNLLDHLLTVEPEPIDPQLPIGALHWGTEKNEPEIGPFYDAPETE